MTFLTWDHDSADLYAGEHDETSFAETVDELLEEKLEHLDESEVEPLTVLAWRRAKVDVEKSARSMAFWAVESLVEHAHDEWGGDDWDPPDHTELEEAIRTALVPWLSEMTPLECEEVGRRTFTRDELLAWGRARGWWGGTP